MIYSTTCTIFCLNNIFPNALVWFEQLNSSNYTQIIIARSVLLLQTHHPNLSTTDLNSSTSIQIDVLLVLCTSVEWFQVAGTWLETCVTIMKLTKKKRREESGTVMRFQSRVRIVPTSVLYASGFIHSICITFVKPIRCLNQIQDLTTKGPNGVTLTFWWEMKLSVTSQLLIFWASYITP